jgi:uncharacterized iron-regulated membrane protein
MSELAAPGRTPWRELHPLARRLHFHAGLLIAPFLVVAALTGLATAFAPQLDDLAYAGIVRATDPAAPAQPVDTQLKAAVEWLPEGQVRQVVVSDDPSRATRVSFALAILPDGVLRAVYVDPATARVLGRIDLTEGRTPLRTTLEHLHRDLLLGEPGRLYAEAAASWLPVVLLAGAVGWLGRRRGRRRADALRVPAPTALRHRTGMRRWHAAVGLWLAAGLAVVAVTGLLFSGHAGARIAAALDAAGGRAPALDVSGVPVRDVTMVPLAAALAGGRGAGLDGELTVFVPTAPGTVMLVAETGPGLRTDRVALDPYSGEVLDAVRWADYPVPAALGALGAAAHTGQLFGPLNQLLLVVLGIGLLAVIGWGYRLTWRRRPTGARWPTAPVPRGVFRALTQPVAFGVVLVAAVVGWLLPVFGLSLLAFLVVDVGLARRRARAISRSGR